MDIAGPVALTIVVALALLLSGTFVAVALGATGLLLLVVMADKSVSAVPLVMFNWLNSYTLSAIPLFVFMGEMLLKSGATETLYASLSRWLKGLPGGLLHANIAACAVFSATSGSSVATAATIGTIALPSFKRRGYDERLTLGSLAAGGTLGILIPPSIVMILYAAMVGESVGQLFIAGVIPGILLSLLFSAYIAAAALIRPALCPREEPASWNERLLGLVDTLPIVLIIFIVLGSIYGGIATPTEAAALGALASLLLTIGLRRLTWRDLRESTLRTVRTSSMLFFVIAGSYILSQAWVALGVTRALPKIVASLDFSPLLILICVYILYTTMGMFIDTLSMLVVTMPVIYPLIVGHLGYNSVWFGVAMVIVSELGMITPPVGANLYVIQGLRQAGGPIADVIRGSLPFCLLMALMLTLLTVFPALATWLPSQMFRPI